MPSPATPPPGLSQMSATTTGLPGRSAARCWARSSPASMPTIGMAVGAAQREDLQADPARQRVALGRVAVGDDQHPRSHFGHVGGHEAMDQRDRQHAVLALQRLDAVDEGAHRLAAGRIDVDHPAVEGGDHGPDLAADRAQRQLDDVLGPLDEIGVREFEEGRQDVGVRDPLGRQVAVRIELGGDHHVRPDDRPDPREEIAFAIVVALRDHGAVQAEHDAVDRQGRARAGRGSRRAAPHRPGAAAARRARPRWRCPRRASKPSARARRRSTTIGAEHSVGVAGCCAGRRHRRPSRNSPGRSGPARTCWFRSRATR